MLHGDGTPTRRYLYAGDAADAFDTILHRGQLGQIYNVGSSDEISNIDLCKKLLVEMGITTPHDNSSSTSSSSPSTTQSDHQRQHTPTSAPAQTHPSPSPPSSSPSASPPSRSLTEPFTHWVKYTHDRPFNDHRYAVDATKLRALGWKQQTSFAEGLRVTVAWYRAFGERWWGDITKVLSPFPVVAGMGKSSLLKLFFLGYGVC